MSETADSPWWRGASIYQIYPASFADGNGDGFGDLPGITSRLDHVAGLGADAVWLSPFFPSPMKDMGYDIADYCNVDPRFGTLEDFDALVGRAHALGLKVIIDQVYAHTSSLHCWFTDSRSGRSAARADWYVWADPRPDGSPPNNWQSVFGGPAWTWDGRRCQYYLHNFLSEQPQLNLHNPAVEDALHSVARFWLARGVDGFRLDAINHGLHDEALRDNPPAPPGRRTRPADYQIPRHNRSHPAMPAFLARFRELVDGYGAIFTLAEVPGADVVADQRAYTAEDRHLNSAYSFAFLHAASLTPGRVARAVGEWPDEPGAGWPSWAFSNHDAPRAVSRWALPAQRDAMARLALLLLFTLRGNPILYQGEELGLPQAAIPFERLRDPEAIANWPLTLGRDGARTPMPWLAGAPHAGFSPADPWLPVGDGHAALAVDRQTADQASVLSLTRTLLALRRAEGALRQGAIEICEAGDAILRYRRVSQGGALAIALNMGGDSVEARTEGSILLAVNDADSARLPPLSGVIARAG